MSAALRTIRAALAFAAGLLAAAAPAAAADGVTWSFDGDLEAALAAAREDARLVMLYAWAGWCAPCHEMERELWPREDVGRLVHSHFVPVKAEVDARTGAGLKLGQRYGIEAVPEVLILDPAGGGVLARTTGLLEPALLERVLRAGRIAHDPAGTLAASSGSPEALLAVVREMAAHEHDAATAAAARLAVEADPACERGGATVEAAVRGARALRALGRLPEAVALLDVPSGACEISAEHADLLWKDRVEYTRALGEPGHTARTYERRARLLPGNVDAQLDWAHWLRDEELRLDEAREVLERTAALAPDDPGPLAELAEIALAQNDPGHAVALLEQAVALAPFDTSLREQLLAAERAQRAARAR